MVCAVPLAIPPAFLFAPLPVVRQADLYEGTARYHRLIDTIHNCSYVATQEVLR